MEAVSLGSTVIRNVEVVRKVPDDQVEVSTEGIGDCTPVVNRPSRLRKTVERFIVSNVEEKKPKEFTIEKGRGTPLGDIPNVVDRVRKRSRGDGILRLVHTLLYGKRGKSFHLKNNILQFSGFVWGENEEKLKGKLQEKLHKYNKEMLLNLCDLLDIRIPKSGTKKEVLVAKLIEFLESPYVTGDLSLDKTNQKQTAQKRKRNVTGTLTKIVNEVLPRKRQKNRVVTQEDEGQTAKENAEDDAKGENDSSSVENHAQEVEVEEGEGVDESSAMKKTGRKRIPKNNTENNEVEKTIVSDGKKQRTTRKRANVGSAVKSNSKEKQVANEDTGKTNKSVDRLSDDDLRSAISQIIGEVTDFETTTYRDTVNQLERRFGIDLSDRKVQLRKMIQNELSRLAEMDDEEDDEEIIGL